MGEYIPKEIEVTPEMIEAGIKALNWSGCGLDGETSWRMGQVAHEVFEAMFEVYRRANTAGDI